MPSVGELIHAGSLPHGLAPSNSVSVTMPVWGRSNVRSPPDLAVLILPDHAVPKIAHFFDEHAVNHYLTPKGFPNEARVGGIRKSHTTPKRDSSLRIAKLMSTSHQRNPCRTEYGQK